MTGYTFDPLQCFLVKENGAGKEFWITELELKQAPGRYVTIQERFDKAVYGMGGTKPSAPPVINPMTKSGFGKSRESEKFASDPAYTWPVYKMYPDVFPEGKKK